MSVEIRRELENVGNKISDFRRSLDLAGKTALATELEKQMSAPDFWSDLAAAQKISQKLAPLKKTIEEMRALDSTWQDAAAAYELSEEEPAYLEECEALLTELGQKLERLEIQVLFADAYDNGNAILSLHPGAGGTESQDWAEMLLRMYVRWGERQGYGVETLDYLPGDEAGVKSVTLQIKGEKAYGYLKAEKGIHRLVRISPFDASGRRHTSFAAVDVLPELEEGDNVIQLNPDDLKIDTYRSGGAGGQHVNKTDSAVRITHIPTGIVVQCQSERSQISNRASAERILKARLLDLRRQEQEQAVADLRGDQQDIAWGSQIRSYVFHPYSMVKDHRTKYEIGNVQAAMDGDITGFMEAWLKARAAGANLAAEQEDV
ncbi:MAG: peptide chain release factor 2 [Peptococcaceae bacterium]|nr:peptide chain release factor 2 [Peptococcaceae bacterium]